METCLHIEKEETQGFNLSYWTPIKTEIKVVYECAKEA